MFQKIIKVKGVTFKNAQRNIRTFGCGDFDSYTLVREPDNPHDPNAIRVTVARVVFLGYVPKDLAKELAPLMDEGRKFTAFFVCRNEDPSHRTVGLTVRIEELPCQQAA